MAWGFGLGFRVQEVHLSSRRDVEQCEGLVNLASFTSKVFKGKKTQVLQMSS